MTKPIISTLLVLAVAVVATTVCKKENSDVSKEPKMPALTLTITSPAFAEGEMIPSLYTCDSSDVSVPLQWSSPPEGTKSFALIFDDPDAPMGTWVHWVLFNIPPDITELPESVSVKESENLSGAIEGFNDFNRTPYGGPCPPSGTHRYFFKLYALDTTLALDEKATKADVEMAMKEHILAQGQLMGRYKRQK